MLEYWTVTTCPLANASVVAMTLGARDLPAAWTTPAPGMRTKARGARRSDAAIKTIKVLLRKIMFGDDRRVFLYCRWPNFHPNHTQINSGEDQALATNS